LDETFGVAGSLVGEQRGCGTRGDGPIAFEVLSRLNGERSGIESN
jgi:hypothetical protein